MKKLSAFSCDWCILMIYGATSFLICQSCNCEWLVLLHESCLMMILRRYYSFRSVLFTGTSESATFTQAHSLIGYWKKYCQSFISILFGKVLNRVCIAHSGFWQCSAIGAHFSGSPLADDFIDANLTIVSPWILYFGYTTTALQAVLKPCLRSAWFYWSKTSSPFYQWSSNSSQISSIQESLMYTR